MGIILSVTQYCRCLCQQKEICPYGLWKSWAETFECYCFKSALRENFHLHHQNPHFTLKSLRNPKAIYAGAALRQMWIELWWVEPLSTTTTTTTTLSALEVTYTCNISLSSYCIIEHDCLFWSCCFLLWVPICYREVPTGPLYVRLSNTTLREAHTRLWQGLLVIFVCCGEEGKVRN